MIVIDKRITDEEIDILRDLVGQMMISVKHDEFHFTNSSSQVVGFETENGMTYLYSFTEPLDYYGSIEDVAVWELTRERYKILEKKNLMSSPVKATIKEIRVVQENQQLFENEQQIYDVWITRGIIFDFGNYQYSFEKPVWFSMDIYIQKGYDLIERFASTDMFVNDDWAKECTAKCERQIEIVK